MSLELIKIKVNKQEFTIALLLNDIVKRELSAKPEIMKKLLSKNSEWICAYVYLNKKVKGELAWETFHKGNMYGIDTNHSHNEDMTIEERRTDAIKQIKLLIKDYFKK